jgi:DNA-binding NtrC family response regulator
MPQMNGLAFAEKCAKHATETPLVLMTGKPRESYPSNIKEVLYKPFPLSEYKRILEKYIRQTH